jgi:mono/diheme cytochrome c family protein
VTFLDSWFSRVALAAAAFALSTGTHAQEAAPAAKEPPPAFTEQVLNDPKNIEVGEAIWQEQCTHCHGAKAYPGKAPKLKPAKYKPDFVWHRVYNGFRGMPPWGEVYTREELIGVVAYVKSHQFAP